MSAGIHPVLAAAQLAIGFEAHRRQINAGLRFVFATHFTFHAIARL